MSVKGTIEGYMAAAADAADELRDLDISISRVKRDLEKLVTQRVGAKMKSDTYRELARVEQSRLVCEEATQREVDIAMMRGVTLTVGDELTPAIKEVLRGDYEPNHSSQASGGNA